MALPGVTVEDHQQGDACRRRLVIAGGHLWSTCTSGLLPMKSAPMSCSAGDLQREVEGRDEGDGPPGPAHAVTHLPCMVA